LDPLSPEIKKPQRVPFLRDLKPPWLRFRQNKKATKKGLQTQTFVAFKFVTFLNHFDFLVKKKIPKEILIKKSNPISIGEMLREGQPPYKKIV
jgi:hypothetical protein